MRALHTVTSLASSAGGPPFAICGWTDALQDAGVHSEIVYERGPGDGPLVLPQRAAHLAVTRSAGRFAGVVSAQRFAKAVQERVRSERFTVLHDHGVWDPEHFLLARIAQRKAVRLAISVHGALEPWALGFRRWKKRLAWAGYQRRTLELADMIFVTTEQEAQSVRRTGVRRPLAVVPIGVETAAPLPEVVREEGTCLFLSRIHPKKGLEAWVRAWAEVSPSWRMSIAGPDADGHRQQIETLVRDLGLARHFTFHGEVHGRDKAALFAAADVFVLPSHSENFGMVVPEALAAATPVLTTSATPWSQLPALGAGWCVEPTTHGLARGLREVLATPAAERRRMGERGRAYVARELAWPAIAQKTIEAYEWMSGGGHARPAHVHLD